MRDKVSFKLRIALSMIAMERK